MAKATASTQSLCTQLCQLGEDLHLANKAHRFFYYSDRFFSTLLQLLEGIWPLNPKIQTGWVSAG